ncbi:MAG: hypothetical protein AAB605_01460 [Patescibacteria group bacterium]
MAAALIALPGIGLYTAGAIRVFAFNEPDVLIETNIRSVFIHHFFSSGTNTITSNGRHKLSYVHDSEIRVIAEQAARGQDPRTWHAALMDYGAYLKKTHLNPSRRSAHRMKQSKFEGSLRQMRGAILKRMVGGKPMIDLRSHSSKRFERALAALINEGMIEKRGRQWRLVSDEREV